MVAPAREVQRALKALTKKGRFRYHEVIGILKNEHANIRAEHDERGGRKERARERMKQRWKS
jgi:hypothetical protein